MRKKSTPCRGLYPSTWPSLWLPLWPPSPRSPQCSPRSTTLVSFCPSHSLTHLRAWCTLYLECSPPHFPLLLFSFTSPLQSHHTERPFLRLLTQVEPYPSPQFNFLVAPDVVSFILSFINRLFPSSTPLEVPTEWRPCLFGSSLSLQRLERCAAW